MKDTIYREDAIKAVCKGCREEFKECAHHWSCPKLNELAAVPSADRPQGKWYKDENGDYRCSECGGCEEQFIYGTENWYGRGESKFCPSCGARMKGASDD